MEGFDLVCRTCGNSSDLGNVHMMVEYSLAELSVLCPICDNEDTYEVEEMFYGVDES